MGIRHGHFYAARLLDFLGLPEDEGIIRVSLLRYNTIAEVERIVQILDYVLCSVVEDATTEDGWSPCGHTWSELENRFMVH